MSIPIPNALVAALLATLAMTLPAGAEDNQRAPEGAWVTQGGSPARNRSTDTAPLRSSPVRAWRHSPNGKLVGEPLVWGDRVVLEEERGAQRALVLLDRASGRIVGPELVFRTPLSLAPALWEDTVVVRAEPDRLRALRIGPRGLGGAWFWRAAGELGEPLLVGRTCYVAAAGTVFALDIGARVPRWSREGGYSGPLAHAPGRLVALLVGASGWQVDHLHPDSGEVRDDLPVWEQGTALGDPRRAQLGLFGEHVMVRPERPFAFGDVSSPSLAVSLHFNAYMAINAVGLGHLSPAAAWSKGFLTRRRFEGEDFWLLSPEGRETFRPLASKDLHASLLEREAAPAVASNVAYVAGLAVDLETFAVLWRTRLLGPLVPMNGGFLHLAPDGALEGWSAGPETPDAPFDAAHFPEAAPGWIAEEGRCVLADGTALSGRLGIAIEEERAVLQRTRGRRVDSWPIDTIALLRDGEGRLVWSSGQRAFVAGIALEAEDLGSAAVQALAKTALRRKDPVAIAELQEPVQRWCGGDEALLESLRAELARIEGQRRRSDPAPDPTFAASLAELETLEVRRLWEAFASLPEDARDTSAFAVLRRVLDLAPEHAAAWSWIAERAPIAGLSSARDAREWLEYLEVAARTPVAVHRPPSADTPGLGDEERALGRAATRWRKDLIGIRSPRLFVISSVARPGVLARVIAHGELLCEALEELFAFGEHDRADRFPLEIRLYDSQEEYLAQSADGVLAHANLTWTAGHYSEHERVSRLFVPDGADGFEQAQDTFLHEVTHHWISQRCPAFTLEQRLDARPDLRGFWVVEGFACLAEGLELDVERGTWRFGAQVGERLDLAAHLPAGEEYPWPRLFRATRALAQMPAGEELVPVGLSRRLGAFIPMDRTALFYAQSAAAARYLFENEDGAKRRALLEYLIAWYRGDTGGVDVGRAFGLEPQQLGERILAWARERVQADG